MALPRARGTGGAIVETTLRALVKPGPARGEILAMDKVLVRGHPPPTSRAPRRAGRGRVGRALRWPGVDVEATRVTAPTTRRRGAWPAIGCLRAKLWLVEVRAGGEAAI